MIVVVVRDEPRPQGSKRAFRHKTTGNVVVVDDNSPKLKNWRESVRGEVQDVMDGRAPIEGPVVLAVTFTVAKPKSAPKTRVTWPERKPDLDKLLRSVMDALKAGGAYKDDAQVVEIIRLGKFYPDPHARVIPGSSAAIMSAMAGTDADVLPGPGAVIRVAAIHEFPGVR